MRRRRATYRNSLLASQSRPEPTEGTTPDASPELVSARMRHLYQNSVDFLQFYMRIENQMRCRSAVLVESVSTFNAMANRADEVRTELIAALKLATESVVELVPESRQRDRVLERLVKKTQAARKWFMDDELQADLGGLTVALGALVRAHRDSVECVTPEVDAVYKALRFLPRLVIYLHRESPRPLRWELVGLLRQASLACWEVMAAGMDFGLEKPDFELIESKAKAAKSSACSTAGSGSAASH